jgi:hypothetical protein
MGAAILRRNGPSEKGLARADRVLLAHRLAVRLHLPQDKAGIRQINFYRGPFALSVP